MNNAALLLYSQFRPLWLALLASVRYELAHGPPDPLRTVAAAVAAFEAGCAIPLAQREVYVGLALRAYPEARAGGDRAKEGLIRGMLILWLRV